MKKLLFIVGVTLLLLSMLFGTFFTNPLPVSAHGTRGAVEAPTTNPYCQVYLQYLAKRLNISVATLLRDKLAAKEDVLAQLVRDGRLTQAQADIDALMTAANQANAPCD